MPYRFIHTADLHLDSPLRTLSVSDPDLAARVGDASRQAFEAIVEQCLTERVDALMIAGDLFDGQRNSVKTALFLVGQLRKLSDAGIETFIVRGNHDARTSLWRGIDLPAGVHVFDGHGGAITAKGGGSVTVHGVSFRDHHAPQSLLPRYAVPGADGVHVGLMHTSLAGAEGHDVYAPCALADLVGHGFAYWGLGHVHGRCVHHAAPDCAVVMPGMPQGRDVGEAGPKSATIVTLDEGNGPDAGVTIDRFATATAEFARCEVPVEAEDGWDDALDAAEGALMDASSRTEAARLIARVTLRGESRDAWRMNRDDDAFGTALADRVDGAIHLEKVQMRVDAPRRAPERKGMGSPAAEGAVAELAGSMRALAVEPEFRAWAAARMERMAKAFPPRAPELRADVFGTDEAGRDAQLDALIEQGLTKVVARLEGSERDTAEHAS